MAERKVLQSAVIGLGMSGATAAIYLARMGLSPIAFERGPIGGKLLECPEIRDYPGFRCSGKELVSSLISQLEENQVTVVQESVTSLKNNPDGTLTLVAGGIEYSFWTVIVATGMSGVIPAVPGAESVSSNISFSPVSEAERVRGEAAIVWGEDDTAVSAALHLSSIASRVYLVSDSKVHMSGSLLSELEGRENAEVILGTVEELKPSQAGISAVISVPDDGARTLDAACLFPVRSARFQSPNTGYIRIPEIKDDQGTIAVDQTTKTFIPGVYACGDCVQKTVRNLAVDASEGALSGVMAYRYYMELVKDGKAE